jgi:hypothetical protein
LSTIRGIVAARNYIVWGTTVVVTAIVISVVVGIVAIVIATAVAITQRATGR